MLWIALCPCFLAEALQVTEEHPFLLNGSWVEAKELKTGDVLTTADGGQVRIKSVTRVQTSGPFAVYNLEAGTYHDFVAGMLKVVVHNSDLGGVSSPFRPAINLARMVKHVRVTDPKLFAHYLEKAEILVRRSSIELDESRLFVSDEYDIWDDILRDADELENRDMLFDALWPKRYEILKPEVSKTEDSAYKAIKAYMGDLNGIVTTQGVSKNNVERLAHGLALLKDDVIDSVIDMGGRIRLEHITNYYATQSGGYSPRSRSSYYVGGRAVYGPEIFIDPEHLDTSVVVHEFAHHITSYYVTKGQLDELIRIFEGNYKSIYGFTPSSLISPYALISPEEMFAESFALWHGWDPYSNYVVGADIGKQMLRNKDADMYRFMYSLQEDGFFTKLGIDPARSKEIQEYMDTGNILNEIFGNMIPSERRGKRSNGEEAFRLYTNMAAKGLNPKDYGITDGTAAALDIALGYHLYHEIRNTELPPGAIEEYSGEQSA